jgi:hypothetical protein
MKMTAVRISKGPGRAEAEAVMMLLYKSQSAARDCAPYWMAINEFHFFTIWPSMAHARTRYPRGVAFHHRPSLPARLFSVISKKYKINQINNKFLE